MTQVDTSIHDKPTGRAAELAERHADRRTVQLLASQPSSGPAQRLTLYGSWFCPFVQRVWFVLHEKAIPHNYHEINPYKKEKQLLDLNPRGLVPTLEIAPARAEGMQQDVQMQALAQAPKKNPTASLDPEAANFKPSSDASTIAMVDSQQRLEKKGLYESSVILDYLDQAYSLTLYPADAYDRACNRLWIDHISSRIVPSFYRFLQHTAEKDYSLESARDEFVKHIYTFAEQLHETGPWFNGSDLMMVDVMLIPWACRIFLLDHYKGGSGIPEAGKAEDEEEKVWGRWRRWFEAVEGRETVKDTLSDRQRYIDVYQRYHEDTTNSMVGQATRGGRSLP